MRTKQADQLQACTSTQSPEHMSAKYVSAKITEKLKHCTTLLVSVFCSSPHRAVLTLRSPLGSNTAGRPKIPVLAGSVQKQKKSVYFADKHSWRCPDFLPEIQFFFVSANTEMSAGVTPADVRTQSDGVAAFWSVTPPSLSPHPDMKVMTGA